MENQGFEEETCLPPRREATTGPVPFDPSRIEFFADSSVSNTDGHVYEDILPNVDITGPSAILRYDRDVGATNVIDPGTRSSALEEMGHGLRRNFTLPFRRGIGFDKCTSSSSVCLAKTRTGHGEKRKEDAASEPIWNVDHVYHDSTFFRVRSTPVQNRSELRPNRRRRKKDCKHCRSKASDAARECEDRKNGPVFRNTDENWTNAGNPLAILDPCNIDPLPATYSPNFTPTIATDPTSIFTLTEANGSEKNRAGMRVNSMYSQDRCWYAKERPIITTDLKGKEYGSFQRAYSLPVRTQTPSSQNRINLRRSARGEPAPYPARLRKHRRGWTLHLAHPLEASRCSRTLVVLLIALLLLLGIGAAALYIVFEPDKLQFIEQYLRSAVNASTPSEEILAAGTLTQPLPEQSWNETTLEWTTMALEPELTPDPSNNVNVNATTRYCDDCLTEEVCVALVNEEVPICRMPLDLLDPTGCAGFCLINKERCHRLDVDAFRCVEVEHYCLDDEWACLNTLCIPMEKHCDGHMNCYDHSDEYNCVCDLETHFQCGNDTSCLPLEKRCDGKIDCWDAADEINCTLACPLENEFTCSSGQCIPKARFCDGLTDCLDESDEPHGCQGRCNKHEFTCQNGRCITKGMKCNGVDDCGDESDERHCKDRFT